MKISKILFLIFVLSICNFHSIAQEEDQSFVIQLATFGSWEDFANHEVEFYANTGTADNNIYAEKTGGLVKVYLFDSQQGTRAYFYPGDHADKVLKTVRKNPNWKGAFRKNSIGDDLTYYGDVFNKYKKDGLPDEYTAKGGAIAPASNDRFKIQLGVFKQEKLIDHIAESYGLNDSDKTNISILLSHDFTKVKKDICRRYYFGEYQSKEAALAKKKELEKKTKRKLMIVKM